MRTTINVDDDVLRAVRELAALSGRSMGEVLSELARRALDPGGESPEVLNGVPILDPVPDAGVVTGEHVSMLLDEP